ncbi:MFS transporter [Streptomyces sp. 4N509B]|uniref:MFS transporter n=1 Tax=Streptomyces sp. 4N509B TaxID=3457413 RepID=UPI003FD3998C
MVADSSSGSSSGTKGQGDASPAVRAVAATGRVLHAAPLAVGRRIRRATHAHGAGETGLGRLIELHAVHSAGDMLITMALASTIFFSVPTDEARGRVALYLGITMAPFILLAPVIGPLLDRVPHGRRAAMAGALLARGMLALVIASAVVSGGLELYPAALGVMVCSKAYNIVRAAVVPRLLPSQISLVKANARITLTGLISAGAAAPLGLALNALGERWPLYAACAITVFGSFLSFRLPHTVDLARGERTVHLAELAETRAATRGGGGGGGGGRVLRGTESPVFKALIANGSLRALSGFLLFFLAFLLRDDPLPGLTAEVSLGLAGLAAGLGNASGNFLGNWLRDRAPELIVLSCLLLALATAGTAALAFGVVTVTAIGAVAGVCQALGKLSLDAMIQRDVPEVVRTSAFARSETALQMSWVLGGSIGIALPLDGTVGMAVACGLVLVGTAATVRSLLSAARRGASRPRLL